MQVENTPNQRGRDSIKDRVDLVSIMLPLEVVAKMINIILYAFWMMHNLVRPNHKCERMRNKVADLWRTKFKITGYFKTRLMTGYA